jgi:hypothetical protein
MSYWYTVRRTYRVEDVVYVEAGSAREARAKAEEGHYVDASDPQAISDTRHGRAERRDVGHLPPDLQHYAKYGEFPS